jgi:aminotransferase
MRLSTRLQHLRQSDIRAVTRMVNAVGGINLGQGICDLPTPAPIKRGAQLAIENDRSIYSNYAGIQRLRDAILEKAQSFNRISATSPEEIMVSAGSTGAFVTAILALMDPGDEAILFQPFYGYHRNLLEVTGMKVAVAKTDWQTGDIDFDRLRALVNDRTRVIVLNTPSNPSGKVWTKGELAEVLTIAEKHDLVIVTDEIYEYMTYDGHEHVSLASLERAYERTITISGFSKTYNMTGWRLGYAVGPEKYLAPMGLLNDLFYICAPTPLQHGVAEAFSMSEQYFADLRSEYDRRRRLLSNTLRDIGFTFQDPEGAYYILASFRGLAERFGGFGSDSEACETLVKKAGVATVPGNSFFENPADGAHLLRFCFAKEIPILEEACRRLREAFPKG